MKLQSAPEGNQPDKGDDQSLRHNRDRHEGFRVGAYIQPPPMLFTADGHNLWLGDMYRGRSCFLICGGPSFGKLDHAPLSRAGLLTMGLNNSPRTFRPRLWCSVDTPASFIRSSWLDSTIQKFAPLCHTNKRLFDSDAWKFMDVKVRDCPNVAYYRRNEHFQPRQFLWESSVNWGNHSQRCNCGGWREKKEKLCPKCGKSDGFGGRSVMLAALRLIFYLGVRRVFLLGCDFNMSESNGYHFRQEREVGSVKGNNETYARMNLWFKASRPLFEREGYHIFNCNPDSKLVAFDHCPYETAIGLALEEFGNIDLANERTEGLYDREAKLKAEKKAGQKRADKLKKRAEKLARKAQKVA